MYGRPSTKSRMAFTGWLPALRAGRTTVVTTTSPLMLDCADQVAFFESGRVVAVGRHRDLLRDVPAYRHVVTREEEVRA